MILHNMLALEDLWFKKIVMQKVSGVKVKAFWCQNLTASKHFGFCGESEVKIGSWCKKLVYKVSMLLKKRV